MPWFSWSAIDFLEGALKSDHSVFEFGSGGSTRFFSERVDNVTSVEDDFHYFELVNKAIEQSRSLNVKYRFADSATTPYAETDFVQALDRIYDVIVIDGSEFWPQKIVRPICFERAEQFVAEGGMIVVDDSWRYDLLIRSRRAKSVQRFQSVGPGRYGVTSTDVYFY